VNYDNTLQKIYSHPFYNKDRIKIIQSEKKSNPAHARNVALESTSSDIVCFLDIDDTWEPNKLECQLKHFDCDVLFTSGWWHRDFGTFLTITDSSDFYSNLFIWSSVMFKKNILDKVKEHRGYIFDEKLSQCDDCELLVYIHKNGGNIKSLKEPLAHIYEYGGNLTQGNVFYADICSMKIWAKYGYPFIALKHFGLGLLALISEWTHTRKYLRVIRMKLNGAKMI
jgi:glycosyltransferase involved in cell wall biosynthesis